MNEELWRSRTERQSRLITGQLKAARHQIEESCALIAAARNVVAKEHVTRLWHRYQYDMRKTTVKISFCQWLVSKGKLEATYGYGDETNTFIVKDQMELVASDFLQLPYEKLSTAWFDTQTAAYINAFHADDGEKIDVEHGTSLYKGRFVATQVFTLRETA